MPTRLLFQEDSYMKEFDATVTGIENNKVYLDVTAFHPRPSGGLDADTGRLVTSSGYELRVVDTVAEGDEVAHIVEGDLSQVSVGEKVHGVLDWERRYRMMQLHTASHVLAAILYENYGARVTGGHISPDMARDDFEINVDNWKKAILDAIEETNKILKRCIEVKIYWLPREEALKIPGIVKLADRIPPSVEQLRIVEIPGIDIQADGGPHVRNTCEVPGIVAVKLQSRGKRRKRVYYALVGEQKREE